MPRLKLSVVIRVFLCDFGYGETRNSQGQLPCLCSSVLVHPWDSIRHGSGDTEVAKKLCSQTQNTEVATQRWLPFQIHKLTPKSDPSGPPSKKHLKGNLPPQDPKQTPKRDPKSAPRGSKRTPKNKIRPKSKPPTEVSTQRWQPHTAQLIRQILYITY